MTLHEMTPKQRKANILGVVLVALVVLLVVAAFAIGLLSNRRADVATANAANLAEQIKTQCAKGPFLVDQRDLCQKAEKVSQDPANPVPGPQGPQGEKGAAGANGSTGATGSAGKDGKDGEPGKNGEPGPPAKTGRKVTQALTGPTARASLAKTARTARTGRPSSERRARTGPTVKTAPQDQPDPADQQGLPVKTGRTARTPPCPAPQAQQVSPAQPARPGSVSPASNVLAPVTPRTGSSLTPTGLRRAATARAASPSPPSPHNPPAAPHPKHTTPKAPANVGALLMPERGSTMATSQNGYAAFSAYGDSHLRSFPWVSGAVNKVAYEIFDLFCADYNATVEKIDKKSSWGFAPRTIRGASTQLSNHASGTALDLNAPKHPLGKVGTFTASQRDAIGRLQAKYPELRWGGSYVGRKDEMHWEVNASPGALAARVQKLKGSGSTIKPAGTVKPKPSKPAASAPNQPDDYKDLVVDGDFGSVTVKAVQILMRAIKTYSRAVDGDWGKYTKIAVQEWLKGLGYYKRAVDGSFGKYSVTALQNFLRAKGLYPASKYVIDGDFGPATIKALQAYLNQQNGK